MPAHTDAMAVVVGAGVSGLAACGALRDAGRAPVVLERSRGLGGRCATRRIDGQPVDHGAPFLHGSDEAFLAIAADVDRSETLPGWPSRIEGEGRPCLPKAFESRETRQAYASGMTVFAKRLARGLDVRLGAEVRSIGEKAGSVVLEIEGGGEVRARDAVLAVPAEAARRLIAPLAGIDRDTAAVASLLRGVGSQACLTAIAGYPLDAPVPDWHVFYPSGSAAIQAIVNDSSKRGSRSRHVLVIQAPPCWSRTHLDDPEEAWARELLVEAGDLLGPWAMKPETVQAHRWRLARAESGTSLSRPLLLRLPGGGRIVVTGESFAPGGGIEAAWLAGIAAALRLVEEE